ncbi:peptidylprolyl isomerase [Chondromyces crocatus]|uniref:PpiC domain-containing protein n=1 Tax=Chondromyces crocatus TaxID=52 RepID=A0A0K1EMI7_CHOCO|nr:peptidylprolyl isomerase [Chondromyces crocatus]AKT41857.1 uncharacterized protein CMC5_060780 [Chondromyces crocatus]
MSHELLLAGCLGIAACGLGCRDEGSPPGDPPPSTQRLEGVVARVGDATITAAAVARVAVAQGVSPQLALEKQIDDELFAREAHERGLVSAGALQNRRNILLSRRLLRALLDEAERAGPVTDTELDEVSSRRWLELDRPEAFRTVHAVVQIPEDADPATRAKATRIAEAIRAAVVPSGDIARQDPPPETQRGAQNPDTAQKAFLDAAASVATEDLKVTAEALSPVTASGRVLRPEPQQFDIAFSGAVAKLEARGDITGVFPSAHGLHVAMLLERVPASVFPREERRRMVHEEVMTARARTAHLALMEGLRRQHGNLVRIVDDADASVALVKIEP